MVNERTVLLKRARTVVLLGIALCVAAVAVVVLARQLGMLGNVYVRDTYWSNGTYLWVGTRGTGWLVLSAGLALVGLPVLAAGIHHHRRERRTDVPVARVA